MKELSLLFLIAIMNLSIPVLFARDIEKKVDDAFKELEETVEKAFSDDGSGVPGSGKEMKECTESDSEKDVMEILSEWKKRRRSILNDEFRREIIDKCRAYSNDSNFDESNKHVSIIDECIAALKYDKRIKEIKAREKKADNEFRKESDKTSPPQKSTLKFSPRVMKSIEKVLEIKKDHRLPSEKRSWVYATKTVSNPIHKQLMTARLLDISVVVKKVAGKDFTKEDAANLLATMYKLPESKKYSDKIEIDHGSAYRLYLQLMRDAGLTGVEVTTSIYH